jgi:hypothetical protein
MIHEKTLSKKSRDVVHLSAPAWEISRSKTVDSGGVSSPEDINLVTR